MEIGRVNAEVCTSLIDRLYSEFSDGIHFAAPMLSLRTNEVDLVRGVLRMLQGFTSSFFYWDKSGRSFRIKSGIYVAHLSKKSLHVILNQFIYAGTCLQLVDNVISGMESSGRIYSPTLRAFSCSASAWLKKFRGIALKEEMKISESDVRFTPTLLGLSSSLSSLCSGAEYLFQIVNEAVPQGYFKSSVSVPPAEIAVHVLDYLYKKLDEVCLVQGGEEEIYQMLLHIFVGSVLPYVEGLDTWLFEGTLHDPFEELFFFANRAISVDEADFWEKSYLLRHLQPRKLDGDPSSLAPGRSCVYLANEKTEMGDREPGSLSNSMKGKEQSSDDLQVCPSFMKDIAKSIVSAGKSLQLIRHVTTIVTAASRKLSDNWIGNSTGAGDLSIIDSEKSIAGLTLSELFCASLAGLIGHGDHISRNFCQDNNCESEILPSLASYTSGQMLSNGNEESLPALACSEKMWYKLLVDTLLPRRAIDRAPARVVDSDIPSVKEENTTTGCENKLLNQKAFCPENPVITVCQTLLNKNTKALKVLNLSRNFHLPPINDEDLRKDALSGDLSGEGTNYAFGFQFVESEYIRSQDDAKLLEMLFPFPTLLPSFQDELRMSELLPQQKNSTLQSRVLGWIQCTEPRTTPLPVVMMRECLIVYIKKQVDHIGRIILSKLMNDWRLMDELAVLRAVYLLGSGDLLQHFLTVIFNKLDKGETWDDDFELNLILQESIRNSADGMLLRAPDSLVVSLTKHSSFDVDEQTSTAAPASTPRKTQAHNAGIDGLDSLKFTYKVPWPLELIANTEAINKYIQVMGFLLKVKRAKFVLDKARKWMWKTKGTARNCHKRHWLVEQKLLHFVDAFHQYVMDRVYHSAWGELCEGMAAARSLDEVIEVHEAYLLSIQRQCFVVPDKLWALIASRVNSILGLALDFYSIQQTLSSGGAISTIKARCEMEVDRIEKQFDDCMVFLLRVLSFKLNVGHFPHPADLVTRINYNYFYMSDSGNLMTAPSSETDRSRLGKAVGSRAK